VPGARIIKRYGNRRMYDHTRSRAVTMEEIAAAVRRGEDLRVLDGDTGEDLTKRVLVQIVLEQQSRSQLELLPIEFLRQILMLRNDGMARWMEQYLRAGAAWLGRQMNPAGPGARAFQDALSNLFPWMRSAPSPSDEGPPSDPEADLRDEISDLQHRLSDLLNRVTPRR
jgi:polyhydroxyalkanoate synthesis repressor PhaR